MDYTNNSARVMKFCQELGCSVPPKNTPHFTVGMYLLNLSYSLLIWNASSLVWHSTTTDTSPSTYNVISDCRWAEPSHHEQTFHTVQSEPNLIFVPAILAATVGIIHLYNNCEAGNQSDVKYRSKLNECTSITHNYHNRRKAIIALVLYWTNFMLWQLQVGWAETQSIVTCPIQWFNSINNVKSSWEFFYLPVPVAAE